jgi:dipeptidase D
MSSQLLDLEPELVWSHFDGIRKVPRPSKKEEAISEHVLAWAKKKGLPTSRDGAGNIVVRVPASSGAEGAPTVVLQGHLDMVCEKNAGVDHDFDSDPIEVKIDGDWVKAEGTTLGADNGLGVACAMAIADDPRAKHGPLELLFTLDEETGLTGAAELDGSLLEGRLLLNLDSEEDGIVTIGCAGGADTLATFSIDRTAPGANGSPCRLVVKGLKGGHSGCDIHLNRANALKLGTRVLRQATLSGIPFEVVSLQGGSKHNAIPREAFFSLYAGKGAIQDLSSLAARLQSELRIEFAAEDAALVLSVEPGSPEPGAKVLAAESARRILHVLNALPHGVLSMSREVEGLVETSNNLAVVTTEKSTVTVVTSHRSSVMSALLAVQDSIRSACELAGADITVKDAYPGWKPDPSSDLLQKTVGVYETTFGKKPEIQAIHAGLECGILLGKLPGCQAISFGPDIRGAHSPDERASIPSTEKFYRWLTALLEKLATA